MLTIPNSERMPGTVYAHNRNKEHYKMHMLLIFGACSKELKGEGVVPKGTGIFSGIELHLTKTYFTNL